MRHWIFLLLVLGFMLKPSGAEAIRLQSIALVGGPLCCNTSQMSAFFGIAVDGAEPAYQGQIVKNQIFFSLFFCAPIEQGSWNVPVTSFGAPQPGGISGLKWFTWRPPIAPACPIDARAAVISRVGGVGILPLVGDYDESLCYSPCGFCPPGGVGI